MAKNELIYVSNKPHIGGYKFLISDSTTIKDVYTGAITEGERITGILILNAGTAKVVTLYLHNGTTAFKIGAISVAANSGINGTVPVVDGMSSTIWPGITRDNAGNKYRLLGNGWKIQAKLDAAVSSDNDIEITVITEDFVAE